MSDEPTPADDPAKGRGKDGPTARDVQEPIGQYSSGEGTWLSGDEEDDPQRDEAAERARRAVEPGRPRE